VVVGDVPATRALDVVTAAFGDWARAPRPPLQLPSLPRPDGRRRLVMPMMSKAQVDIAYGFATVTRRDPDYYALTLMNNVLGQYGLGGRLGDSIRERQGMAYYAFSTFDGNVGEGPSSSGRASRRSTSTGPSTPSTRRCAASSSRGSRPTSWPTRSGT
jgi:zinc protease